MEGQKMMTTMIKVKTDTRALLGELKVVQRESYDDVIQRLIQHFAEDQLELNSQTRKVLLERTKNIKEGKVLSFQQMLDSIKKEVAKAKRGEINKKNSGRLDENATDGS